MSNFLVMMIMLQHNQLQGGPGMSTELHPSSNQCDNCIYFPLVMPLHVNDFELPQSAHEKGKCHDPILVVVCLPICVCMIHQPMRLLSYTQFLWTSPSLNTLFWNIYGLKASFCKLSYVKEKIKLYSCVSLMIIYWVYVCIQGHPRCSFESKS